MNEHGDGEEGEEDGIGGDRGTIAIEGRVGGTGVEFTWIVGTIIDDTHDGGAESIATIRW